MRPATIGAPGLFVCTLRACVNPGLLQTLHHAGIFYIDGVEVLSGVRWLRRTPQSGARD